MAKSLRLKSHCTHCGRNDVCNYRGGIERHKCKHCGNVWTKSAQSTFNAIPWAEHMRDRANPAPSGVGKKA